MVFIRKGGVGTKLNYRITFYAAKKKKKNFFALVRFELDTCNFILIHRPGNANIILYLFFLQNMMNG